MKQVIATGSITASNLRENSFILPKCTVQGRQVTLAGVVIEFREVADDLGILVFEYRRTRNSLAGVR